LFFRYLVFGFSGYGIGSGAMMGFEGVPPLVCEGGIRRFYGYCGGAKSEKFFRIRAFLFSPQKTKIFFVKAWFLC